MAKLFIAVGLPPASAQELVRIQPPPMTGVRSAEPSQMHVTVRFIGEADPEKIKTALEGCSFAPFWLEVEGVGRFASSDGTTTLWAGVMRNEGLLGLRKRIASSLCAAGYPDKESTYNPHITVARCRPGTPSAVIHRFLEENREFRVRAPMNTVGLYSSTIENDVPSYRVEASFDLSGTERE